MTLDVALRDADKRKSTTPVFTEINRIISVKQKILDRWPDIVTLPPERDQELIINQMLTILKQDDWSNVKLSFVLKALGIAFSSKFRHLTEVKPIIDFTMQELSVTTHETYLNAMVAIYFSSYEPNADHSLQIGRQIASKKEILNSKWKAVLMLYSNLFDGKSVHNSIAQSIVSSTEPWVTLRSQGFSDPHATGLMDFVHIAFVEKIKLKLNTNNVIEQLFAWLHPQPSKRKLTGSIKVIESVLSHWLRDKPTDELRENLTEQLISQYNDPRTNQALWVGVEKKYLDVIYSWLTREDMRFFIRVVDEAQKDPQWQPRKKLWLQLFDEKLIEHAWVAFCPGAQRKAREILNARGFNDNARRFGKQTKGSSRNDTSILLMKIGNHIVVDGCHNYRTHFFNIDDHVAPKLFLTAYDCDRDVMDLAAHSKSHSSIPAWQDWVRRSIFSVTPMSVKRQLRHRALLVGNKDSN